MNFKVHPALFEILPDACFGFVVARGLDNWNMNLEAAALLQNSIQAVRAELGEINIRELPGIAAYRKAFQVLGYNPNKFMCSIEALVKRILKGGEFPLINTAVDLGNAMSLRHILPIGAHDINVCKDDIEIRFAVQGDTFVPFGSKKSEAVDVGELVYTRGNSVKTRKWIWRQGVSGMISEKSTDIFYPIDGFTGINDTVVKVARDELAGILGKIPGCSISVGWVDKNTMKTKIA